MPSRYRGKFGLACSAMIALIREQHGSSAKDSKSADIIDDPIVARIGYRSNNMFFLNLRTADPSISEKVIRPQKQCDLVRYSRTTHVDALCCTTRMRSHSRRSDWIPKVDDAVRVVARRGSMTVRRCLCCCRWFGVAFFGRTRLARCSHFGARAHGVGQKGPCQRWGLVIFSARSARSVRQRAYATCPTKQNASAPNTVADTRCATGVRRRGATRFPVGIPTVSLPVQSAAPGEHPVIGIVQHAGSVKPRTRARRHRFKRWPLTRSPKTCAVWLHQWRAKPRELCSDPENWIQATLAGDIGGFTKRGLGVVRVTCIITRLSAWSRTAIRSSWRSPDGSVKSARLRWAPYSDSSLARPQSAARIAVRRCWGRR